jgi:hypothetical protein
MPRQAQPVALRPVDRLELQRWVAAHGSRNKWRSAVKSSFRRPKANRTKRLLQACRSTLKPWRCGGPGFAPKAPIVCERWQRGGDVSCTIRTKRSKRLLTPHSKLAPQEPRTGVAEPWPSSKVSARARLIECGGVISSNPHLQKTFKLSRDAKFLEKLSDVGAVPQSARKSPGVARG